MIVKFEPDEEAPAYFGKIYEQITLLTPISLPDPLLVYGRVLLTEMEKNKNAP